MCLGIPGQIIEVTDEATDTAAVMLSGTRRNVNVAMVHADGIAPGDWVLVHAGFALSTLDEREALDMLEMLREMSDAYMADVGMKT